MRPLDISAALCLLATLGFILIKRHKAKELRLPPGPKRYPIVGHALSIPKSFEWITYAKWGKDLNSEIIQLDLFGQSIIILNSFRAAKELLDRRSSIYSGRPEYTMLCDLMYSGWLFVLMQYGPDWKSRRSLFHKEFHHTAVDRYHPQALRAVREYLHFFLDSPENFMVHLRNEVGAVATSVAYGIKVKKIHDPIIDNAEKAIDGLSQAMVPGRFYVDSLPILKYVPEWMPGAGFQKLAKDWSVYVKKMVEDPYAEVKRNIAKGPVEPCFVTHCWDNMKADDDDHQELIIKESAGNFYFGATETTLSALATFILAMVCYPDVQAKAQAELDRALRPGHLPDFDDLPSLPYISALVKEVNRWKPVTPIGVPHVLKTDDVFDGYHLPAGSIIIGNSWAMLHDEEMYPDPSTFNPDRFLKDGKLNADIRDPADSGAFGFGRRVCPAAHMAVALTFIAAATMLSTFNISKAIDENGVEIEPSQIYTSGIVSHPVPFKCKIVPRSREAEVLIRSAADTVH